MYSLLSKLEEDIAEIKKTDKSASNDFLVYILKHQLLQYSAWSSQIANNV